MTTQTEILEMIDEEWFGWFKPKVALSQLTKQEGL